MHTVTRNFIHCVRDDTLRNGFLLTTYLFYAQGGSRKYSGNRGSIQGIGCQWSPTNVRAATAVEKQNILRKNHRVVLAAAGKLKRVNITGRTPTVQLDKDPDIISVNLLRFNIYSLILIVHINGRKVQMIVDSGAAVSIIKKNIIPAVIPLSEKVFLRSVKGESVGG